MLRNDVADEAGSIFEALRLLRSSAFDIVVARWSSEFGGGFDGLDLVRQLQRVSNSTPIVLYDETVRTDDEIAFALDVGADDIVFRPLVRPAEFVARLRAVQRRTSSRHEHRTLLRVGRLAIDLGSHQIFVDGCAIASLTRGEFRFLAYLARRQGVTVPKIELYRMVFESKYRGRESNALPALVSRLRRKLGGAANQLAAISGVGYALDAQDKRDMKSASLSMGSSRVDAVLIER